MNIRRFWSNVAKAGDGDCWMWQGSKDIYGYGVYGWRRGKTRKAHRLVWQMTTGTELPSETLVCHRCDQPLCVNPAHLFLGTARDNMRDKADKGRCNQERHRNNNAKLDDVLVGKIRTLVLSGTTQRNVARSLGLSEALVSLVVNGKCWT